MKKLEIYQIDFGKVVAYCQKTNYNILVKRRLYVKTIKIFDPKRLDIHTY